MRPLISIIVPVYNVEKYLHKCINSILDQTCENFELILVDDGSSDSSGEICDEYARKDRRILVRHIENSGVSNARNIGMKNASGVWILFLDGDDILELNTIDIINQNILEHKDMDMLLGSYKYILNKKIVSEDNKDSYKKGIETLYEYGLWDIKTCMGSFAVKKEIVDKNNILFNTTTKYGEDVEFISYCLANSLNVKITNEYFMNYIIHNESAIASVGFNRYDCYEARYRTLDFLKGKFPDRKDIEALYNDYLLPEAIIDTTYLLCRNGINIFKIMSYLNKNSYYIVIDSVKGNKNTPIHIRNRINKFLKRPILTWTECYFIMKYYEVRQRLGLLKRRIFK